jgi:glycosyltransferase involved in cell wall biosynthesis
MEAASTRFRATQFFPFLEAHGVSCELASMMTAQEFATFYSTTGRLKKAVRLIGGGVTQALRTAQARRFDVVIVQRGALIFGPPILEWILARVARVPLVFDFDDAIWLQDPISVWGRLATLTKWPSKVREIVAMASQVVVCNAYTRDFAIQFARPERVTVIPTVVDTDLFHPIEKDGSAEPTVGWIGTHSTARYLAELVEPIRQAAVGRRFRLMIVGSARAWTIPGVDVIAKPWSLATEVADYQSLDIGLYPVRDDEWGRGKTGFKPVVYMSSGVACIASPVGGVTEFLKDDVNGRLASTAEEWRVALAQLVDDPAGRERLAVEGRRTVVGWYSLDKQGPRLLEVLRAAVR